jgi:hypothetical protein
MSAALLRVALYPGGCSSSVITLSDDPTFFDRKLVVYNVGNCETNRNKEQTTVSATEKEAGRSREQETACTLRKE